MYSVLIWCKSCNFGTAVFSLLFDESWFVILNVTRLFLCNVYKQVISTYNKAISILSYIVEVYRFKIMKLYLIDVLNYVVAFLKKVLHELSIAWLPVSEFYKYLFCSKQIVEVVWFYCHKSVLLPTQKQGHFNLHFL